MDDVVDVAVGRAVILDGLGFADVVVGAVDFVFGEVTDLAGSVLVASLFTVVDDVDGARD